MSYYNDRNNSSGGGWLLIFLLFFLLMAGADDAESKMLDYYGTLTVSNGVAYTAEGLTELGFAQRLSEHLSVTESVGHFGKVPYIGVGLRVDNSGRFMFGCEATLHGESHPALTGKFQFKPYAMIRVAEFENSRVYLTYTHFSNANLREGINAGRDFLGMTLRFP